MHIMRISMKSNPLIRRSTGVVLLVGVLAGITVGILVGVRIRPMNPKE